MTEQARTIGLTLSKRIIAGLVGPDGLIGSLHSYPEDQYYEDALVEMPREHLIAAMCEQIVAVAKDNNGAELSGIGVALPGVVRHGVVDDAPNLPQMKGARIVAELTTMLKEQGIEAPVTAVNDADAAAAGLAQQQGKLDSMIRVWTIGTGIGFGRYPMVEGVGEGGHTVVTLDDRETYCGCGGRGHIEGIMGHRAMRLRFLDMEPEDVFEAADKGDARCIEFKKLWHKALAAGTASSIHMSGAGKFYLTGYNVRFVELPLLNHYVQQMVRMSPLQAFSIEIRPENLEMMVVGAAVIARTTAVSPTTA
ncbi:transcriptional regulator/sugar kinase [Terriglobus roseus DSM 18391]|uniref:Transcriptional regulator/sugar kinase n=1 Tax=Terriglobus roseus (strain DSM 18391 / NRRL B-41598 / KBS 63) TaxID=926566 RepID=I3ZBN6_TERRK|nr:ROK family protein [Terriglobus roseus]AFL86654.1 transcriptional regulator/sugar kinase [Terriglobus roseus DSM 18391]